ncbi:Transporter aclS [Colletotrichum fructicola]|uniref:Ncs1 nucleoside transporter n=1 Tax=Colletotrichum fructicola (strain Nara gc5) TaxID=1213859 RepID=L2GIP3_COLFN|nr:Transporter [Colletotrichum fructicola]KAF4485033.1 Transporter aclS [Colletotrichum fructicola Nara gc5]KAI8288361.1 Transporter acIS [Colletotrichum sp. SAR11_57]KAJ5014996.1 Transporter acIS [Colletotrichum sp. SAR 10_99]KAE9582174.1 Transporter [Colletotrichum fructicola]KAF4431151.1 Transporter aclS [Colletotrichum fructicola]
MGLNGVLRWLRLPDTEVAESNIWINEDIRPMPPDRRRWTTSTFISFWLTNQVAISNWQLGASLVAAGLSVWQSVIAIIIGKIIIAVVAIANGCVGAEWHIGFPVVSRYIWGVYGQYLILIQRIILSLVWFAVQSWTGGLTVVNCLSAIFPSFESLGNVFPENSHLTTKDFIGWIIFNVLLIPILYIRPERIQKVLLAFNIISSVTLVSIMIWALATAGEAGSLVRQGSKSMTSSELGWQIVHGITTVIGSIAVGLTNQPDYCRFARRPGDQIFGQWFSIIFFGAIFPTFGCLAASATGVIYGEPIWNPPLIVQAWLDNNYNAKSRAGAFFAGLGLLCIQLSINSVDNAFSAGMDLAGLFCRYINIRRGAYIGLVLSIALCPWELLSSASVFISVLSAYSVFLGPVIGIQICDYFIIRRRKIKLSDLYHPRSDGSFYYWKGINPRTFIAWVCGFATQLPGFAASVTPDSVHVADAWINLYYLAFPLGFTISFLLHLAINTVWPPPEAGIIDEMDYYGTFTEEEARKMGVVTLETEVIEGSPKAVEASGFDQGARGWLKSMLK